LVFSDKSLHPIDFVLIFIGFNELCLKIYDDQLDEPKIQIPLYFINLLLEQISYSNKEKVIEIYKEALALLSKNFLAHTFDFFPSPVGESVKSAVKKSKVKSILKTPSLKSDFLELSSLRRLSLFKNAVKLRIGEEIFKPGEEEPIMPFREETEALERKEEIDRETSPEELPPSLVPGTLGTSFSLPTRSFVSPLEDSYPKDVLSPEQAKKLSPVKGRAIKILSSPKEDLLSSPTVGEIGKGSPMGVFGFPVSKKITLPPISPSSPFLPSSLKDDEKKEKVLTTAARCAAPFEGSSLLSPVHFRRRPLSERQGLRPRLTSPEDNVKSPKGEDFKKTTPPSLGILRYAVKPLGNK
jgi:hypothetical protein